MRNPFPEAWQPYLSDQLEQPYFQNLTSFVAEERQNYTIYPPKGQTFTALELTPYEEVRVLILGQDPYHGAGQAHGLAFSVQPGVRPPPSLENMFKELQSDLGCPISKNGSLIPWAEQGVMLLNAVLTVREKSANSHKDKGWEKFTDHIISLLSAREKPVIFVLWGAYARKKVKLIDRSRHIVIESAHPSPLSAHNGFFGSKPFSKINQALEEMGETPIDWCLSGK
jgi:uracil-DNA glycosylase